MSPLDYIIVSFYLALTLIIGLWAGRNIKNINDYAVGGRNFTTTTLVMTICATNISGGTLITSASELFKVGLIDMYASTGLILCNIIIAYIIAPRVKPFLGLISTGEVMQEIYGKSGRYLAAICGTLVCIGFVAGQVKALSTFFNYFLEINVATATYISCFIIIAYSSFGGVRAVTFTDTIQFLTLAGAIPMVYNLGLEVVNGYEGLLERTPATHLTIIDHTEFFKYTLLLLFFALPGINPAIMQRMLMAKNTEQIHNSFKISAWVILPYRFFASMIGLVVLALNPDLVPNNAFMFLINNYLPIGIKGLAIIGMLAVVMSTADSYMNAASVSFTHDLIKPLFGNKLSEKAELKLAKYFTLIIGLLAVAIAMSFKSILKLVLFVQGFYIPIITMPLLLGLFGFRSSNRAFLAGATAGGLTFLIWKLYDLDNVAGFDSLLPCLIINGITLLSTHYLLKEKGGWVKAKKSIRVDAV
ncbi:MAG: sodium:solute symporter family protein [Rickettsiaceae bacterium]|jgi:Na+/proline symporter|nr:sodium:solute symporter family protein [Rickettsiaceae bacterium]